MFDRARKKLRPFANRVYVYSRARADASAIATRMRITTKLRPAGHMAILCDNDVIINDEKLKAAESLIHMIQCSSCTGRKCLALSILCVLHGEGGGGGGGGGEEQSLGVNTTHYTLPTQT